MNKKTLKKPSKNNVQINSYIEAVQRGMRSYYVVPSEKGWKVKKAGAAQGRQFGTQKEAIEFGKVAARNGRSELFIHGKDGRIRDRSSFSRDVVVQ